MGLSQSLYSGISGLQTHQKCMDNIGNNLANVNTVAFKKGVFQFRTLLEQTLRGGSSADAQTGRGAINPLQIGLGTQTGSIMKNFETGSVEITGNQRDMMITGNGFFVLRNGNSSVYTRDGAFYIGSDGSLLYGNGLQVQGIMADGKGNVSPTGNYTDVRIPIGQTGAAVMTSKASFTGNLNSNVEIAAGLKLAANANAINSNDALSKFLGVVKDAAFGSGADDSTWNILKAGENGYINGGTTWTCASLGVKDPTTGAMKEAVLSGPAATPLQDLWYLSGTTWTQPFKNIDNPPQFTTNGASQSQLTQWKFNKIGFRMDDRFNYELIQNPDPLRPNEFLMEIYKKTEPYNKVLNDLRNVTAANAVQVITDAYASLLSTTSTDDQGWSLWADITSAAPPAWSRAADSINVNWAAIRLALVGTFNGNGWAGKGLASGITGDFKAQGSDIVAFKTTVGGAAFAASKDPTLTGSQRSSAFDGTVRFGNFLTDGSGELMSYTPSNVDQQITVSYMKGGRQYIAEFEYSDKNGSQSYNIEHLMKFLCGTVDQTVNADSIQAIQTPLTVPPVGGIMGTVQMAGLVSSSIDGGQYGYNVPPETAGAFTRGGITNNVAYSGKFKPVGGDATQLLNAKMDSAGYALKTKWYYSVDAYPIGANNYQYSTTMYSDSARTQPVSTTAKMLGEGDNEMKRTFNISPVDLGIALFGVGDPDATAKAKELNYGYRITYNTLVGAVGDNYTIDILDKNGVTVLATGTSANGSATTGDLNVAINTIARLGPPPVTARLVGGVDFPPSTTTNPKMKDGDMGYIYMNNMDNTVGASNLPIVGTVGIPMTTTVQGTTYASNNGIGAFTALTAFNGQIDFGGNLLATDINRSVGSFDSAGASQNYSVLSNLGIDNAITDISFAFNSVSYNDIWNQDSQYSAQQGGSATTNMIVYDSLGNPKKITMTMSMVARDSNFSTYRWIAESFDSTDAQWQIDPASKEIKTNSNVGCGTIRFDANGQYVKGVEISETQGIYLPLKNQGVNDLMRISLIQGLSRNAMQNLDFSFLTQVASSSDFNLKEQNGSPPGTLETFTTSLDGVIQGVYSNGVVKAIARLAIALIPNMNGLMSAGNNLYFTSPASGDAQISFAGIGGRGQVQAASLESSNVDLSTEFTKLITTQRGFQANSRIISTSDEMLQELVNLKR